MQEIAIRPLGTIIKSARKATGLTQAQVARSMDVSAVYISSLERHVTIPSIDFVDRIVRLFERHAYEIDQFEISVATSMLKSKVSLKHLGAQQRSLVIQLATMTLTPADRARLTNLLKEFRK